jgi:hypothetical protein
MYKLPLKPLIGEAPKCIVRIADNAFIPFDLANTDYQEYLKWLEEGNTPLPADNSPEEPTE